MSFLVQRLSDYRFNLGREEFIRPMLWGSNWNSLRIAALVQVNTASTFVNPFSFPQIALGVTTGNSGILVDTTVDVIGGCPAIASANFTYGSGSGAYYVGAATVGATSFQKIGSTFTTVTAGATAAYLGALQQAGNALVGRTPIVVDIVKSTLATGVASPYTVTLWTPSTNANLVDCPPATFFGGTSAAQVGVQSFNAPYGITAALTSDGAPATLAVTGNMLHDSAFLMWNRTQPTLDVSAFVVIRFA